LILDIESKLTLKKPINKKESESNIIYLTAFGELMFNKTIYMSTILANKTFSYLLILEDMTKPTLVTNPFIYILNISSPRYTLDVFLGIIIDTKASKKSTTGYG
jgi:hypothetical protein